MLFIDIVVMSIAYGMLELTEKEEKQKEWFTIVEMVIVIISLTLNSIFF